MIESALPQYRSFLLARYDFPEIIRQNAIKIGSSFWPDGGPWDGHHPQESQLLLFGRVQDA
jgi:hypothetical protein